MKYRKRIPKVLKPYVEKLELVKTVETANEAKRLDAKLANATEIAKGSFTEETKKLMIEQELCGMIDTIKVEDSMRLNEAVSLYIEQSKVSKREYDNRVYFFTELFPNMIKYVYEDNPKTRDISSKHLNDIAKIIQVIPSRNHIDLKRVDTYELISKSLNGEYDKYPKLNVETVNKMIRRIRSLSLYGYRTGLFDMKGAIQTVKNHRSFRDERKALEPKEIELISSATDIQEVKDFITLLQYSGMRLGELNKYTMKEIDGIECFDLREAESLKTMSSFRVIPRHPKIENIDFTYTYEHLSRVVKRLIGKNLKEADKKTTYSLRHTFASELIKVGVDSVLVSELLGHSHKTMTMNRYVKGYPVQVLKEAIDKL